MLIISSGADLTFATQSTAPSQANVKSKAPLESISSSGPSIPTFAIVLAKTGCECWNWTTSRSFLRTPHGPFQRRDPRRRRKPASGRADAHASEAAFDHLALDHARRRLCDPEGVDRDQTRRGPGRERP